MRRWRRVAIAAIALGALGAAETSKASSALSGTTTADNDFFAYVSTNPAVLGTPIGSGDSWPSAFTVSSSTLGAGTYYLQVEAIDQGPPAAFSGIFSLTGDGLFANGSQTLTTDPANIPFWTGGFNDNNGAFTPQPWVMPTGSVVQATSFSWGNIVGTANWIWPSDASSGGATGQCGNCTVDFMAQFTVGTGISSGVPEPGTWALMLLGVGAIGASLRTNRRTATAAV